MKIKLSIKEAKILINCLYDKQCIANMCPEMRVDVADMLPEMCMNKPEEPTLLSDEEVHNEIVSMCMHKKVNLYINEILIGTTDKPNYDQIAEELYPYDGEIVSIINEDDNWFINTL